VRLTPGTRVGPYEVLALLGAGGMAEVYRAKDSRLGREVAIKVVSEALGGDGAFLERFDREAKLAASLTHPNVVALHDVGLHEGKPYFVTELLQGESLRERLVKGAVPLGTALEWAAQMAQGLAAAHERGIVHRDLKPENIFITRDGHIKLLDFGIAKLVETAQAAAPHGLMDATLSPTGRSTGTGMVLGTPGYMSPEQVRGDSIDARTDFFSLGAVLYEMLSGRRAFPAGSVVESGHAILHHEPEPLPSTIPWPVAQIVHRCLEKDPARRFQSARDLAFNLELVQPSIGSLSAMTPPLLGHVWHRWWWLLPLSLAAAVGGWLLWNASFARQTPPLIRQLTFSRGRVVSARFGPDGRTVFFSASWRGEPPRVYSTTLDTPDYHPLGIDDAALAAVSGSGELAVILRVEYVLLDLVVGTLALAPGVGGAPREVVDGVWDADFAPDGVGMAVVRRAVDKWQLEFPVGHVLYSSPRPLSQPRVAPTGDQIAFIEHDVLGEPSGNVVVVDRGGQTRVLLEKWASVSALAWAPTGEEVWLTGEPSHLTDALWALRPGRAARLLYRGTGSLMLQDVRRERRALVLEDDMRQELAVLNVATKDIDDHIGLFDWAAMGGLSNDGHSILFSEAGVATNEPYWLYLRKTDGSEPVKLGSGKGLGISPDGRWVLAVRDDQPHRIWVLPTSAGTSRSLDIGELSFARSGSVLPDGKQAVIAARKDGILRAYLVDLEAGRARAVTPPLKDWRIARLAVSPDGRFLAAVPLDGVITTYSIEDGSATRFPELGLDCEPVGWGKSGLMVRVGSTFPVRILRVDDHVSTLVTTLNPQGLTGTTTVDSVRITPDEKTVAYSYRQHNSALFLFDFDVGLH
jgi:serine/threonine protein kinase